MLNSGRYRLPGASAGAAMLALVVLACTQSPDVPTDGSGMASAKPAGGTGPTVTSTNPPYGHQGDAGLVVGITGSGFAPGAVATWERNGSPDPKVTVNSTRYISSTQLEANITIAADATISLYDVAVTAGGKKGIGTERFEVSTAIAILGAGLARGVNNTGEITGRDPVYLWSPSTGLDTIATGGAGWGVSEDGQTVVGGLGNGSVTGTIPMVWTRNGSGWAATSLPRSSGAKAGNAQAVASNPSTNSATAIGGVETFVLKGNSFRREPRVWLWTGSAWQLKVLRGAAGGTEGQVHDLNAGLVAAGNTPSGATIWTPNGSGGWTATVIGPAGSDANAINSAGDLAVGASGNVAVYWTRSASGWSGPIALPGGCTNASDMADNGRIVTNLCPVSSIRKTSAVIEPPYGPGNVTFLSGFGSSTDGAQVEAISRDGHWIVGRAAYGNNNTIVAAYWNMF
ncbi:MAG: hypothetical protein OEW80_12875 [Gemmatimonadota bacterium]|nr:hypothetical protein [Gemmatimonadota bacterium]